MKERKRKSKKQKIIKSLWVSYLTKAGGEYLC